MVNVGAKVENNEEFSKFGVLEHKKTLPKLQASRAKTWAKYAIFHDLFFTFHSLLPLALSKHLRLLFWFGEFAQNRVFGRKIHSLRYW